MAKKTAELSEKDQAKALAKAEKAEAKALAKAEKALTKKKSKIRESTGDRVVLGFTTAVLIFVLVIVGYPVIYVISCSFSSNTALTTGRVLLWPVDFTLDGYKFVFQFKQLYVGYRNTIFYTISGTLITMVLTTLGAYPLSKRNYQGRSLFMTIFFLTTLFGAGLIPTYLLKSRLGMVNTVWAVILAGAVGVRNMIILRTAFQSSIPGELFDAAAIDGANDFQSLWKIGIPLAKATMSVLTLYAAVGCWNDYFNALIYLSNPELQPLQLFLRNIMKVGGGIEAQSVSSADALAQVNNGTEGIKYSLIIISTVPVLAMYAVVQKYFKTGVMVGSVKG